MIDSYGRRIDYLRISLTDACNLRCVYCMPEEMRFKPRAELLQDDEILAIVRAAAALGTTKIRLTGGEPTIRPGMVELVRSIAAVPGIDKVAMTTNGLLLAELAEPLAQAGLRAINVSIDTLNPAKFRRITRWGDLHRVWDGVAAAEAAGIHPLKLNAVVTRGFNEDEVTALARLSIDRPWHIRFIELMPFGSVADFQQESVVSSAGDPGADRGGPWAAPPGPRPGWPRSGQTLPPGRCTRPNRLYQHGHRAVLRRVQPLPLDGRRQAAAVSSPRSGS